MVKQTAGRDQLGAFAPKFAELNDPLCRKSCCRLLYPFP